MSDYALAIDLRTDGQLVVPLDAAPDERTAQAVAHALVVGRWVLVHLPSGEAVA